MAVNQKTIFVYDDFSTDQPVFMGILYVNVIKGGESYSFEYDKDWLKKKVVSLLSFTTAITCLAYTMKPEWAVSALSQIQRNRSFLMIRKPRLLPGLRFAHWRKPPETLKMMKQVYLKNG